MKKKNFTLVELLCATALVVILAGIGFSAYSYASYRGREASTKSLITRLEAGLETLKTKHGFYPPSNGQYQIIKFIYSVSGSNATGLITGVNFNGGNTNQLTAAQLKDFLAVIDGESLKNFLVLVSNDEHDLTDAWGGGIYYRYPGKVNTVKFDIIAPGADGLFGSGISNNPTAAPKDVTGENAKVTRSYYVDSNGEWACDDIANFK